MPVLSSAKQRELICITSTTKLLRSHCGFSVFSSLNCLDAKENDDMVLGEGGTAIKVDMSLDHPWKNITHQQGTDALDLNLGYRQTIVLSH